MTAQSVSRHERRCLERASPACRRVRDARPARIDSSGHGSASDVPSAESVTVDAPNAAPERTSLLVVRRGNDSDVI
jgi:hypothetical protein